MNEKKLVIHDMRKTCDESKRECSKCGNLEYALHPVDLCPYCYDNSPSRKYLREGRKAMRKFYESGYTNKQVADLCRVSIDAIMGLFYSKEDYERTSISSASKRIVKAAIEERLIQIEIEQMEVNDG